MDVLKLITDSYKDAKIKKIEALSPQELHNKRSHEWVESLADRFRVAFIADKSVKVFSRHNSSNRADFGLNELLFDVTVATVGMVESAVHKKNLFFIKEALWLVESEFARDSRQALIDFNKLVLGSAKNKLFIGPKVQNQEAFIAVLIPAAAECSGSVYAAFIPHPKDWDSNVSSPEVFQFEKENRRWVQYRGTGTSI